MALSCIAFEIKSEIGVLVENRDFFVPFALEVPIGRPVKITCGAEKTRMV